MRAIKIKDVFIDFCEAFTITMIILLILRGCYKGELNDLRTDIILILQWTAITVVSLNFHKFFDRLPLGIIIIIQYLISLTLVFAITFIEGIFIELAKTAYRDVFISFTFLFIGIAIVYYIEIWLYVRKQNKSLEFIKSKSKQ